MPTPTVCEISCRAVRRLMSRGPKWISPLMLPLGGFLVGIEEHGVGLDDAERELVVEAHGAVHGVGDAAVGVELGGRGVRVAAEGVAEVAGRKAVGRGGGFVEEDEFDVGIAASE